MNEALYKSAIEFSSEGFAYYKMILDESGKPCDYEFIEVNPAFERITGLKAEDIIGHRASEVLPDQYFQDFGWVSFFGRIAMQGISAERKYFSHWLNLWIHIQAYSPEKYYFITHLRDITLDMERLEEQETINTAFNDVIFELNERYEFTNIYAADDCYLFKPKEEIIGNHINQVINSELAEKFIEAFTKAVRLGKKQYIEYNLPLSGAQWWYKADIIYRESLAQEKKYIVVARNHSDQKSMEKDLKVSATQLERFFSINLDLLCIADTEGNFIKVNKEWESVLGFTVDELEKMKFMDFVHPGDKETTLAALNELKQQKPLLNFVNRYFSKDGTYRYIEWRSKPYGNYFYAAARDITDKIHEEEQLRRSEANLKEAHAIARMGRWELDLSTHYLDWSEGIYEMFEVSPESFAASYESFLGFVHPADRELVDLAYSQSVKNRQPYEITHRLLMPDGRVKWVSEIGRTEYDSQGKPLRSHGTVQNITRLKQAQQVLYEEKERLRVTLRSIGDAVITTDKHGVITDINTVAEKLTGWSTAQAIGKLLQEVFHIIDSTTNEVCDDPVQRVLKAGTICELENETKLVAKNGKEIHIADSAAPICDDAGKIQGVVLVFRDTSAEKLKQDKIAYLSYHDSLTGLYNRRYFEEQIERLDTPRNLPLSIIVGDVNGLKLTNDAFGHLIGDDLLQQAAAILQEACRADDIIARWGGDEFVIILPKANQHDANQVIQRIKDASAQVELVPVNLSISFGSHTKVTPDEDIIEILKGAEDNMYKQKLLESQKVIGETINKIVETLHVSNNREMLHARRVAELCKQTGQAMGLSKEKCKELEMCGFMHDIGKIAVPGSILSKTDKLQAEDWNELRRHPEVGYRILSSYNEIADIAGFILAHHERVDGSGYPKGLIGEEIPLQVKILAVADAFDAMTGEGHYKLQLQPDVAVAELQAKAGTQFDRHVVQIFVEKVLAREAKKWD